MNRRQFNYVIGMFGLGLLSSKVINREILASESKKISLYELEQTIMKEILIKDNNPELLIKEYNNALKNNILSNKINYIRKKLADLVLEKVNNIPQEGYSDEEKNKFNLDLINEYSKIDYHKKNHKLEVDYLQEIDFINPKDHKDKDNYKLLKTLSRIAPDAEFIKLACHESKIPLEDVIAMIDTESNGNEFIISRLGAINRFQLNPNYLNEIYHNITSLDHHLGEYLKKNAFGKNFTKKVVEDSKINAAFGIGLMKFLKENTNSESAYVVSYLYGLGGFSNLKPAIVDTLENLTNNVNEKTRIKHPSISYYKDFLNSRKQFKELRESYL